MDCGDDNEGRTAVLEGSPQRDTWGLETFCQFLFGGHLSRAWKPRICTPNTKAELPTHPPPAVGQQEPQAPHRTPPSKPNEDALPKAPPPPELKHGVPQALGRYLWAEDDGPRWSQERLTLV